MELYDIDITVRLRVPAYNEDEAMAVASDQFKKGAYNDAALVVVCKECFHPYTEWRRKEDKIGAWLDGIYTPAECGDYRARYDGAVEALKVAGFQVKCSPVGNRAVHGVTHTGVV